MTHQWLPPPIHANVREQSVLNLIPLACSWWKVTDPDGNAKLIRQLLQFKLPQTNPRAIATTAICCNYQLLGIGIERFSHYQPPSTNRGHGKACRIVIRTDTDPASIVGQVIDTIGVGSSQLFIHKVIHVDLLWISLWTPFLPTVLELPDQFFLLGINRNYRLPSTHRFFCSGVYILKLCVAIRVVSSFKCFTIALQTISELFQQTAS